MVKKRHFFIIMGVVIVGFVFGSFFDLQINQALFHKHNFFGLFMASFAVYPCYAGLAFIGGGLLATTMKRKDLPLVARIFSYALAGLAYLMSVYLCGREWPSVNGFDMPQIAPLSYALAAVILGGVSVGAFFVCRKGEANNLWPALLVMAVIFALALLPAGFVIKLIIHRPRFRLFMEDPEIPFCNWWESFKEYKEFLSSHADKVYDNFTLTKEEFKSFPSGHSGTAAIMMMFLPYASMFFKKLKGKETLLFYIGFAWTLLMGFSRMLVGAHYLSDVCMGALIVTVVYYITNEIALRKKWIYQEETSEPQS